LEEGASPALTAAAKRNTSTGTAIDEIIRKKWFWLVRWIAFVDNLLESSSVLFVAIGIAL